MHQMKRLRKAGYRLVLAAMDQRGQDAFEYLLATGVIVALVGALLLGFTDVIPKIVGFACPTIDPLGGGICHFS
jgi:hypothetical protein